MSARTAYLTASCSATVLVIGLTILITSIAMFEAVGPSTVTGVVATTVGIIATAVTGVRAAREYASYRVAQADSAALARAIIQHDTTLTAPHERSVVAFERRPTRENT